MAKVISKEEKVNKATGLKLDVMSISADSSNRELDKLINKKVNSWIESHDCEIVGYQVSVDFSHNGQGSALVVVIYK